MSEGSLGAGRVTTQPRQCCMCSGEFVALWRKQDLSFLPSLQFKPCSLLNVSWLVFLTEIISPSLPHVQLGCSLAILLFPTLKRNSSEPSPAVSEMPGASNQVQFVCSLCLHFISRESTLQVSRQGLQLVCLWLFSPLWEVVTGGAGSRLVHLKEF